MEKIAPIQEISKIIFEDTNLAAALLLAGCPPYDPCPSQATEVYGRDGTVQKRRRYKFEPLPETQKIVAAWVDRQRWEQFEKENLAEMQAVTKRQIVFVCRWFCYMRDRYRDAINQGAVLELHPHPTIPDSWIVKKAPPYASRNNGSR